MHSALPLQAPWMGTRQRDEVRSQTREAQQSVSTEQAMELLSSGQHLPPWQSSVAIIPEVQQSDAAAHAPLLAEHWQLALKQELLRQSVAPQQLAPKPPSAQVLVVDEHEPEQQSAATEQGELAPPLPQELPVHRPEQHSAFEEQPLDASVQQVLPVALHVSFVQQAWLAHDSVGSEQVSTHLPAVQCPEQQSE
jgi:hypothetical protein